MVDALFLRLNLTERVLKNFLRWIAKMPSLPMLESKLLTTLTWSPQKGQVTGQKP